MKSERVRFQAKFPFQFYPRELTIVLSPPDIATVDKLPEKDREMHTPVSPRISHLLLCNQLPQL